MYLFEKKSVGERKNEEKQEENSTENR